MNQVILSNDLETAYLAGSQAMVTEVETTSKTTTSFLKPENSNRKWAFWGADDNRPKSIIDKVEKNVVASSGLEWLVNAFFGNGLITYKVKYDNGKEIMEPYLVPEIEDFFSRNNIFDYLEESIWDFIYFRSNFPEMYLGRERYRDKIVKIKPLEATSSRWGLMDEKTHRIDKLYYSHQFPTAREGDYTTVPVFDPRNSTRYNKFVYRPAFASIGRKYYPKPSWHSVVDSGWLDISNAIPGYKQSLFRKQMADIKYLIKIPKNYWSDKYRGYEKMTLDEQKEIRTRELMELNDFLSKPENDRIAFISHYGIDKRTGKEIPGWSIEPIDNKFKDGIMIPDSLDADHKILFALNLDPALKGASLNSKLTSEGGSNKREAFTIFNSTLYMARQRFLQPFYFIQRFNGWDPDVRFGFKDMVMTTLDKNPTGQQKAVSG